MGIYAQTEAISDEKKTEEWEKKNIEELDMSWRCGFSFCRSSPQKMHICIQHMCMQTDLIRKKNEKNSRMT